MLPMGRDLDTTTEALVQIKAFPPSLWKHIDYLYSSGIAVDSEPIQRAIEFISGQSIPINVVRCYLKMNLIRLDDEREVYLKEYYDKLLLRQIRTGSDLGVARFQRMSLEVGIVLENAIREALYGKEVEKNGKKERVIKKLSPAEIKALISSMRELVNADPVINFESPETRMKDLGKINGERTKEIVDEVIGEIVEYRDAKEEVDDTLHNFEAQTQRIVNGEAD